MQELQVQPLDEELRSHMLCNVSKKKKESFDLYLINTRIIKPLKKQQ